MIKGVIQSHKRTLLICILISLALYMTAAYKSAIYLHPDEYYQIVEFASCKMAITTPDQMAWEFGEKIRPAFQPLLCYSFLRTMDFIHITDHYTQLFILRLLSALLSLFAISFFCISSLPFISTAYRKIYIAGSYFFWYPYTYGVHFSSETWSGAVILIAASLTAIYYHGPPKNSARFFSILGLLLGVAFLLRFQTAFISLGIIAWLLFEKKTPFRNISAIVLTAAFVLIMGAMIDKWFYGEWLCIPWRYFDFAFIHQHTDFGTQPFYFYPLFLTLMLTPPIGIAVVIGTLILFYTRPHSLYTWILLPFLFFHTLIGHKEFRFLYPIISFFPLIIVMGYQGLKEKNWFVIPRWLPGLATAGIMAFNILGIVVFVFFSDRFLFDSKIFCEQIHQMATSKKVVVYCSNLNDSPFTLPRASIPRDLFPEYLRDSNVTQVVMPDLSRVGPSGPDTIRLIATDLYEYEHILPHLPPAVIVMHTLADFSSFKNLIGARAYMNISKNTYYLIEYK